MVQISFSLLFVVAAATIVPTLAHPYRHARYEETGTAGSASSRRFYGGDSSFVARDVGVDLQQRGWLLHPIDTLKNHHRINVITNAARAKAKADIEQERADALSGPSRREYVSATLAERSFDDFDLEARDFEEEY